MRIQVLALSLAFLNIGLFRSLASTDTESSLVRHGRAKKNEDDSRNFIGEPPRILIAYHSVSGGTRQLVNFTAGGALQCCNSTVESVDVADLGVDDTNSTASFLQSFDGIILGSGVYNGDVHPVLSAWIVSWPLRDVDLSWTVGAAVCTSGGYATGAQHTLRSMMRMLQTFQVIDAGGTSWRNSEGACAIVEGSEGAKGMKDVDSAAENAQQLGYRIALLASQLKVSKKSLRDANQDPFDYRNPDRLGIQWPPRVLPDQ